MVIFSCLENRVSEAVVLVCATAGPIRPPLHVTTNKQTDWANDDVPWPVEKQGLRKPFILLFSHLFELSHSTETTSRQQSKFICRRIFKASAILTGPSALWLDKWRHSSQNGIWWSCIDTNLDRFIGDRAGNYFKRDDPYFEATQDTPGVYTCTVKTD